MRIGAHISGGVAGAAERACELGCDCMQIFTASPRQWKAPPLAPERALALRTACARGSIAPLVVHANYLINLAGANAEFHAGSRAAFRAELERAAAVGADYLVLHPGSGDQGRCTESILAAAEGFAWGGLRLLIENTAGAGQHLGGDFAQVGAILDALAPHVPVGACIDTCHAWVAGYDLRSPSGYQATLAALEADVSIERVHVFHLNDAKADRGSHLDRHEHIGAGKLGRACFRRLLQDRRLGDKAFVLETPVDAPDAQARDLAALRELARTRPRKSSSRPASAR